jgi:hypothetical protein
MKLGTRWLGRLRPRRRLSGRVSASLKFFMPDVVRETMSGLGWPARITT